MKHNIAQDNPVLQAGDRAPDAALPDGAWLSDVHCGTHFSVVLFIKSEGLAQKLHSRFNSAVNIILLDDAFAGYFGYNQHMYAIRPDDYIGMIAPIDLEAELIEYLDSYLMNS